jgi:hypothetical protein
MQREQRGSVHELHASESRERCVVVMKFMMLLQRFHASLATHSVGLKDERIDGRPTGDAHGMHLAFATLNGNASASIGRALKGRLGWKVLLVVVSPVWLLGSWVVASSPRS